MSKAALLATVGPIPAGVILMMAVKTVETLRAEAQDLVDRNAEIVAAADGESRDLTDAEIEEIETIRASVEKLTKQINAREPLVTTGAGRRTAADPAQPANPTTRAAAVPATARSADTLRCGFRNFGEQALAVRAVAIGRATDEQRNRLNAAATTYSSEQVGEDGSFVIIPEFRRDIVQTVTGESTLLAQTDRMTIGSNQLVVPKDETTPWETDKGILAFWEGEAAQLTGSKMSLDQLNSRLTRLTCLVPVTDELLEDATAIDSYLRRKAPEKMNAKINTAIIRGTGVGQPQGILLSGSKVTVDHETTQAVDTIMFENVKNMYARLYRSDAAKPVWLYNQDCLSQLIGMKFSSTASSPVPVWLPGNNIAGQPYDTLWGIKAMPFQACSTVGTEGDLILADMSQYLTATRGTDIRTDVSMHFYFDQAMTAYRFIFRLAGQPWRSTPITPQQSASPLLGSFVTLATRTGS